MSPHQTTDSLDLSSDEAVELASRLTRGARRLVRDLVRVRDQRGFSRSQLADAIGIHKSGISRFERQETSPRLETVLRYAQAVGADIMFAVEPVDGWHCADDAVVTHLRSWRGSSAAHNAPRLDDQGVWEERIAVRL
ncbi:helix-turn-helix transcriptional regulator [Mycobacterium heidelbergense]|uniref:Uncharacterized protein n=1 Tax=Mycobacterium heidelbergense TaxID=53376 RepID=A0A1X0DQJ6_MYCHE|nr:helix-turn-helix transcriptional regulator [Mycobacterium heidelbergense]MCV7053113.1 helix-turn-helix transcriptional regulator [Mycobacterium heidelbergense]ORA74666.1 hypothetical protein BST25_08840 [Mycobacterium heidelbergense]BBZ51240.1 hypothetical protein MHEI_29570 [Mycobacterium heidelbergense]